jgi:hypothetical protein
MESVSRRTFVTLTGAPALFFRAVGPGTIAAGGLCLKTNPYGVGRFCNMIMPTELAKRPRR